ncbi:dual specificity protein phosphatase 1 [Quercus robur]|uniref:dual specificity protein phosphatase 1 n=1 Tax=Quercus robur TaxID=38942 RepID=UPI002161F8AB|nr:dual specificity protein phosphatase 1 [Quercus robur]
MDQFDESIRKQVAALFRVISFTRCIKDDNVPCKIEEGLFLGSVGAANNKDALKALNVTHVLTVASALLPGHPNDFVYKIINVADREDTDIKQYFDECFNFIDEAKRLGGGVLVHCLVGRSRSVTVVVAYLMKKHGMNLSQALEHVKTKRPRAGPNSGFITQLQDYEKSLQDGRAT